MKKSLLIPIAIVLIIAGLDFALLDSEKQEGFTSESIGRVDSAGMDLGLLVCNPSVLPVTVDTMRGDLGSGPGRHGVFSVQGKTIPPLSSEILSSRLDFADSADMERFVEGVLNESQSPDTGAAVFVKAKLLGIIPYSYETNYDSRSFSNLLFGGGGPLCQAANSGDLKQQLKLVQARLSAANLLYLDKIGLQNETGRTNDASQNETNLTLH